MLIKTIGERSETGRKGEEVVVISHRFRFIPWYAEEGLSSDQLKEKTSETPYVKGLIDRSGKNKLGRPEADWSHGLDRWLLKEIGYRNKILMCD
jgi:hypothetical protein